MYDVVIMMVLFVVFNGFYLVRSIIMKKKNLFVVCVLFVFVVLFVVYVVGCGKLCSVFD